MRVVGAVTLARTARKGVQIGVDQRVVTVEMAHA